MPFFVSQDWDGLANHLSRLSNMDFRKTEKVIRESVLPELDAPAYWTAMLHLIIYKKAAFLTGILVVGELLKKDAAALQCQEATDFALFVRKEHPDALRKLANMALPLLTSEQQIDDLFRLFDIHDELLRVATLLKAPSPLTYFALFKTLKMIPDNDDLVRKCCIHIMKAGNDMAFNMVSILKAYFGTENVKSQLSLNIDTYELNYLDRNYDTFLHILNGRRPRI